MHSKSLSRWTTALWILGVCLSASVARAQFSIAGLTDEEVYADDVTFHVQTSPGFTFTILLNDEPIAPDVDVTVDRPEYYELSVAAVEDGTGVETTALVQFIVRSSARGDSEWGLSPWVPYAPIASASAEYDGATLHVVAPAGYPADLDIPIATFVRDEGGKRVGVVGTVSVTAAGRNDESFRLLRGVGSHLLAPAGSSGTLDLAVSVGPLDVARSIAIDENTTWTEVSGSINADADWGEDGRVFITSDLSVASGVSLDIGAGTVVKIAPDVEISVAGTLRVNGTTARPVVFTPESHATPWGGILFRGSTSRGEMTGAILTGSGANDNWFDDTPDSGSSHRREQPLIYVSNAARVTLTDCSLFDNHGQAGHGEDGFLTMNRCLVQRCITVGQYNRGAVNLTDSALLEFPDADAPFEDEDNDAFYMTGGAHVLTNCLVGWALDDGLDAGSGSGGSVDVIGCWIESCYHEGMAWSEARVATVRDTVSINNGQGIECGFDNPDVDAERILSTANHVGARFGDNYDWDYEGFLKVADSLLLFNKRDVWGRAWDNWDLHLDQMDVQGNWLSAPNENHPNNAIWDPVVDADRLEPFLPTPATVVGVGIATPGRVVSLASLADGVPVRLSTFTTRTVSVDYGIDTDAGSIASGTLEFVAGETVKFIPLNPEELSDAAFVAVSISNPSSAEITGLSDVFVLEDVVLIARDAVWKYLDDGSNQGIAWRAPAFDDSEWPSGPAELGYGDDDEATVINGGPSNDRIPTAYFRRSFEIAPGTNFASLAVGFRRDDGGIVFLNGAEVFRSNMSAGEIQFDDFAPGTTSSESTFYTTDVDPALLVQGTNVIAAEVHQANATSSDLSFALELIGKPLPPDTEPPPPRFERGDANADHRFDISDAVRTLLVLFAEAPSLLCDDAADANDDGALDVSDGIFMLEALFQQGPLPSAPAPGDCGPDPTDDELECGGTGCV